MKSRSESGSTLLWAIGVLVLLSVVGAMISQMSPSSLQGKLEQEAGMRAYYNANSGLNYILGMESSGENGGTNFANFLANMGGGSTVTVNLSGDDYYSFKLGNTVTSGSNGTYQIASLVGGVKNSSGGTPYAYVVYGGGKGNSAVQQYTVASQNIRPTFNSNSISAQTVYVAGGVIGSVITEVSNISGGSKITGSYIVTSATSPMNISGGITVATEANSIVCSNYGIYIDGGSNVINGNVYSPGTGDGKGYVTLTGGSTVNGNVYANSTVTIRGGSHVYGQVHSQKDITLTEGAGIGKSSSQGNALSNYTPTFDGGGTSYTDINSQQGVTLQCVNLSGNIHYNTLLTKSVDCTKWKTGTEDHNPTAPTPPTACETYAQPTIPTFTATSPLHINGSMPPFTAGNYYYTYIDTTSWGTLYFDTTDGDINILVSGNISISGNVYVKGKGDKSYHSISLTDSSVIAAAPYIYTYTGGSFTLGGGTDWVGTVLANGNIYPSSATIVGSLHSIKGIVNPDNSWYNIKVVGLHN